MNSASTQCIAVDSIFFIHLFFKCLRKCTVKRKDLLKPHKDHPMFISITYYRAIASFGTVMKCVLKFSPPETPTQTPRFSIESQLSFH